MIVIFVITFNEVVRIDRKITALKHAASDGKLGVLDVNPISIMAVKETGGTEFPSSSIATTSSDIRIQSESECQPSSTSRILGNILHSKKLNHRTMQF